MTKKELMDSIQDLPDECVIDIYNFENYSHPSFKINTETYFDYDKGLPSITFELNNND